jgi:hypothetical protein
VLASLKDKRFVRHCETAKADPRCKSQGLRSLLILPVQRVPRYKLLLEELLKVSVTSMRCAPVPAS